MVGRAGWSVVLRRPRAARLGRSGNPLFQTFGGSALTRILLPRSNRAPETKRFSPGFQNVCAVRQAVQHGFAQARAGEYLRPFGKRPIGRHNHSRFLSAIRYDLKQQLGTYFSQWHMAELIDNNQFVTRPSTQRTSRPCRAFNMCHRRS